MSSRPDCKLSGKLDCRKDGLLAVLPLSGVAIRSAGRVAGNPSSFLAGKSFRMLRGQTTSHPAVWIACWLVVWTAGFLACLPF
jgi:hypothetical protein